ncbi:DUF4446 family protein [Anaeromicropila herbilytica]|uniref:DUF4446 family protein n=1 Tax=Anaeromicropila herbilytica TaxID=2785025 RepID=A0A7R7EQ60_9FIRM|nr:DUF4446 family protein [Anaeromicropila herbilytica]BCN33015.1 hypothetical protein bsdtb5_43100 [Anaeromicropila herbilytica]
MDLFNNLGIDIGYVLIGLSGLTFIVLLLLIITMIKQSKLKKKYNLFMSGADGKTIEKQILDKFEEVDQVKEDISSIKSKLDIIDTTLLVTYQKVGIVKYDAFKEMGGKLSFALTLLNKENDGFIINSMHSSREGCYTYVKEIIKGESFVVLSDEEKKSLEDAIASKKYIE